MTIHDMYVQLCHTHDVIYTLHTNTPVQTQGTELYTEKLQSIKSIWFVRVQGDQLQIWPS